LTNDRKIARVEISFSRSEFQQSQNPKQPDPANILFAFEYLSFLKIEINFEIKLNLFLNKNKRDVT
jgi:hypothetical protein